MLVFMKAAGFVSFCLFICLVVGWMKLLHHYVVVVLLKTINVFFKSCSVPNFF